MHPAHSASEFIDLFYDAECTHTHTHTYTHTHTGATIIFLNAHFSLWIQPKKLDFAITLLDKNPTVAEIPNQD